MRYPQAVAMFATLLLFFGILAARPFVYGQIGVTQNFGIVTHTVLGHCVGVELVGAPGVFVDVDC